VRKNVAGQVIAAEMVSVDDGSAFTGTVTVYITGDGGAQAIGTVGSGVCTHEGNGLHTYQPSQGETNYTHLAFTFVGTGAVPVTIQVYTNVDTQLLDIQSRIPATLDGGNMRSSVQSMAANTLTASVLATDAVTEIQTGLATSTGVTAGFTEIKGTGWSSSTDTLEKISESSGGGNITVAPLQATAPNRVAGTQVVTYINDISDIGPIAVSDSNGDAVDLSAYTLKVCIEQRDGTVLQNATPTVSGTGNNQIAWTPNAASVASTGTLRWSLRVVSTGQVLALGDFIIDPAAKIST